jgi:hypothetical protein
MEFDFYNKYKDYATAELVKIIHQPDSYQPAAVEAANRIIAERGVTEEELLQEAVSEEPQEEIMPDGKQNLLPESWEETKPPLWVSIVFVVVALQIAWSFFTNFYSFYKEMRFGFFNIDFFFYFFPIVYLPVTGYLLLKKYTAGWILLFAWALLVVVTNAGYALLLIWYSNFHVERQYGLLWRIVFNAALLFCLWKPVLHHYFGVSELTKKRTLGIGFSITMVFLVYMYLRSSSL